jgi:hypothetical protein
MAGRPDATALWIRTPTDGTWLASVHAIVIGRGDPCVANQTCVADRARVAGDRGTRRCRWRAVSMTTNDQHRDQHAHHASSLADNARVCPFSRRRTVDAARTTNATRRHRRCMPGLIPMSARPPRVRLSGGHVQACERRVGIMPDVARQRSTKYVSLCTARIGTPSARRARRTSSSLRLCSCSLHRRRTRLAACGKPSRSTPAGSAVARRRRAIASVAVRVDATGAASASVYVLGPAAFAWTGRTVGVREALVVAARGLEIALPDVLVGVGTVQTGRNARGAISIYKWFHLVGCDRGVTPTPAVHTDTSGL